MVLASFITAAPFAVKTLSTQGWRISSAGKKGAEEPSKEGSLGAESENDTSVPDEPMWTWRGHRLRSSDFASAMIHLFRAYVNRADVWRSRLDSTTNWAVVTTAAAISLTFSEGSTSPVVISLCTVLVTLFLWIEARRYRYYELFSLRVRLLETDFYAAMLVPPFQPDPMWAESLARSLLTPAFPISSWEAFGRRFRHNYVWIYLVLALAWVVHVWIHPTPASHWDEVLERASLGAVPGWAMLGVGALFNLVLLAIGLLTMGLTQAAGEVLDRSVMLDFFEQMEWKLPQASGAPPSHARPLRRERRPELLVMVVTRRKEALGKRLLEDVHRGVTAVPATGMFTGAEQSVLLCALTVTELERLRRVVRQVDAQALVVTLPARDVRGLGFTPLDRDEQKAGSLEQEFGPP